MCAHSIPHDTYMIWVLDTFLSDIKTGSADLIQKTEFSYPSQLICLSCIGPFPKFCIWMTAQLWDSVQLHSFNHYKDGWMNVSCSKYWVVTLNPNTSFASDLLVQWHTAESPFILWRESEETSSCVFLIICLFSPLWMSGAVNSKCQVIARKTADDCST